MNLKLFALLVSATFGATNALQAQQAMSLKDCLNYGLQHNVTVKRAQLDLKANHDVIMQGVSAYLPQINGSANLTDNLRRQTSILNLGQSLSGLGNVFVIKPGADITSFGKPSATQIGVQYNISGGVTASQTIYDQTYISGIKAARQSNGIYAAQIEQQQQQVIYDIASAYYQAQITNEQRKLVAANLMRVAELERTTKVQLQNGFAKQTDYDRIVVQKTNLETNLQNANIGLTQLMLLLKFQMGMDVNEPIAIDTIISHDAQKLIAENERFSAERTPDYQVLKANIEVQNTLRDQTLAGYVPKLSFVFNYAGQYQSTNNFEFWKKTDPSSWYPYYNFGFSLSVPIFDGLNKHYKAQQQKIQLQQFSLDETRLRQSLIMQNANAQNTMQSRVSSVKAQHDNLDLSMEIYNTTQLQYQQGMATMSDLLNAETSLKESQTNYLNAVVQLKLAELDALKSSGNIRSILE